MNCCLSFLLLALCLGAFLSVPGLADRQSFLTDPDLPNECLDRKLGNAPDSDSEEALEEKLFAFFEARRNDKTCQPKFAIALKDYEEKRTALLAAISAGLDGNAATPSMDRRVVNKEAGKAIKLAESAFLGAKMRLFFPSIAEPQSLFGRCGFCASRPLERKPVQDEAGNSLVRYLADGSCLLYDDLLEGDSPDQRYENTWNIFTDLRSYPRDPVKLGGYDHVFAFHRVTPNGDLFVHPDEKDPKVLAEGNDLKKNPDSFLYIAAGIHYGFTLVYYYFVENHLFPTEIKGDAKQFWIKYATTNNNALQNAEPAVTQFRFNASDAPKGLRPTLLVHSKGERCARAKTPKTAGKKKYYYDRYLTQGDVDSNSSAVEKAARITLLETIFENARKSRERLKSP